MAKSKAKGYFKDTVQFIDISTEAKKTMEGLSKQALRASGRVVTKTLKEKLPKWTGNLKNHVATWVLTDKDTGQPKMVVGFQTAARVRKKGKKPSHSSPHWVEFGTKPHTMPLPKHRGSFMAYEERDMYFGYYVKHPGRRATHVLRDTVQNNIDEIQKAQEKYLVKLNEELEKAGAFALEEDEVVDE